MKYIVKYCYKKVEQWDGRQNAFFFADNINGLAQDCTNSSASAMELLQSCAIDMFKLFFFVRKLFCCLFNVIQISLKFFAKGPDNNIPALVNIWITIT